MLESEIKKLTVAVEANTAALIGDAAPAAATSPAEAIGSVVPAADPLAAAAAIDIPAVDNTPAVEAAPTADLKMITQGIVALCKSKGREAAAKLMAEYGAQKVPELKKVADKYDEILAKINALIEAK